ncbi:MAG: alpha/beta hydrolase [Candidatus Promineifilaceae bacterium]|nr:alpha/beta hydrolase [Candidatus Promineifilaceae bacterium]
MMRTTIKIWALLIPLLLLAACGGNKQDIIIVEEEIAAIDAEIGQITPLDCPLSLSVEVEGETIDCGVYTVPVNYDDPQGDTINLTYTILRASGDNPVPDPIVYLAGGPGQSGVVSAAGILYGDLRQDRDLIFPAQRGTLFAGRLGLEECLNFLSEQLGSDDLKAFVEEVSANQKPDASLPYADYLAQYSVSTGRINGRCHEAFTTAGLDPTQFTTANSTNDLIGLLTALGYDSFNLHGVSYGTRLALETVRRHPEAGIRSVVLDSPAAPSSSRLNLLASATHHMVLRLFADCEANPDCNAAYPNLAQRTANLLDQLTVQPITAGEQTIGPDEFIQQLQDLSNTRSNYVPRMIAELEAGKTETYLALLNGEVGIEGPEGSAISPTINALIQTVSAAGATADDPFGGLKYVSEILPKATEDNPREAMKSAAQDSLQDNEALPQALEEIDALSADDIRTLQAMYAEPVGEQLSEAETILRSEAIAKNSALFLLSGIVCSEELAFEDPETAVASQASLEIQALAASGALLATEVGNCTNYPMGDVDPGYNEPIASDVPVLVLQGEFDIRTPLQNGLDLAEQLSNATLAIIPQQGHETWSSATNCVGQISTNFIRNPQQAPDLSCLEQRQEQFSLPGEPLTQAGE